LLETSMMLVIAPELVAKDYKKVPNLYAKDRAWLRALERLIIFVSKKLPLKPETKEQIAVGVRVGAIDLSWILGGREAGYHGAPALSSAPMGEGILQAVSRDMASAMEDVFEKGVDPMAFRSSAFLFRWVQNFFLALVVIAFALTMLSLI